MSRRVTDIIAHGYGVVHDEGDEGHDDPQEAEEDPVLPDPGEGVLPDEGDHPGHLLVGLAPASSGGGKW